MRKALTPSFAHVADIRLTDYKVRIVDEASGTAATPRVMIDSSDGEATWTTVGSSTNIIEASWLALADSYEYGIQRTLAARQPALSASGR
jgi:2-isopropylmalate synthase